MHSVQANGAAIPAIGLGTSQLRGELCARLVSEALRAGYRHIDTAVMYGNEEAVGQGLRASGVQRDGVFVTTKVLREDLDEGDLQRSAEASLKRLGLSTVDLLLVHWPNPSIPLERTMRALADARRSGLARHVGVANFTVALLDEAARLCPEPLAANQVEYHPHLDQTKVLTACRGHGMALVAYSPLGRGVLLKDAVVSEIARERGLSPARIVLRWLVQQAGVVAIPRTSKSDRLAENMDVFGFSLLADEMARLHARAGPRGRTLDPAGWAPRWDS